MTVARADHVDAGDAGKRAGGIFHHRPFGAVLDAAMGKGDDDIGAGSTDERNPGACGFQHVARLQVA
ncbi:MAG TPA: hypothetical protein VKN37_02965 [Roseovarius sp.]|nr:hypothetical protein [Roseovarius sp.]